MYEKPVDVNGYTGTETSIHTKTVQEVAILGLFVKFEWKDSGINGYSETAME